MTFTRTLLAAAVAAATTAPSAGATPVILHVSGATAQEEILVLAAVNRCPGTSPITVRATGNFRQIVCDGGNQIVHKSGAGGSGNGVRPVFDRTAVPFVTHWGNCTSTTTNLVAVLDAGTRTYDRLSGCTITTGGVVPDAGLSDVEPALFGVPVTEFKGGRSEGTSALTFGIIASQVLRTAMQAAQGLNCDLDGNGTITDVERNAEACMPTMSNDEVASIFAANLGNASALQGGPVVAGGLVPGAIDVAFRVPSSGTQVISQVVFLNQGCTGDVPGIQPTPLPGGVLVNSFSGRVTSNDGGGDLRNVVRDADIAGRAAIGVLSTETAPTANWGYVKIDGVSPSIENVINGSYDYVSFNAATTSHTLLGDTTGKLTLWDGLVQDLSSVRAIGLANARFGTSAFGGLQGGFVADYTAVLGGATPTPRPVTRAQAIANPVYPGSKDNFGGTQNNCGPVQIF